MRERDREKGRERGKERDGEGERGGMAHFITSDIYIILLSTVRRKREMKR